MSSDTLELTIEEATSTTEEEVTGDVWELSIETGERGPAGPPGPAGSGGGDVYLDEPNIFTQPQTVDLSTPVTPVAEIGTTKPFAVLHLGDSSDVFQSAIDFGGGDVYSTSGTLVRKVDSGGTPTDDWLMYSFGYVGGGLFRPVFSNVTSTDPGELPWLSDLVSALPSPFRVGDGTEDSDAVSKGQFDTATAGLVSKSLIDAKGDLVAGTADDTPARVAVGANGKVLTADSAEPTGLKWGDAPVPTARTINTTAPLTGGGDLSADRTIGLATPPSGLYVSGSLYLSWSPISGGIRSVAPGSVVFWPVILDGPAILDGLSIDVTVGGASGAGHLYLVTPSATTGRPTSSSTILATASNIATATNSTRVTASFDASATVSLGPGWAWAMFHSIVGTPTLRSTSGGWFAPPPVQATTASTANGLACINGTGAGTSTTALTSLSGITIGTDLTQAPLIQWRVA